MTDTTSEFVKAVEQAVPQPTGFKKPIPAGPNVTLEASISEPILSHDHTADKVAIRFAVEVYAYVPSDSAPHFHHARIDEIVWERFKVARRALLADIYADVISETHRIESVLAASAMYGDGDVQEAIRRVRDIRRRCLSD